MGAGQTPPQGLGACLGCPWAGLGDQGLRTRRGHTRTMECGMGSGSVLGAVALMCMGAAEHACDGGALGG